MSFAFLYPLAWLGALAVAVPLWLHLERRREANLIEFSALRFLDDQPVARSRPWWPRDLLLLLLRILGLLLLMAAFSWPYRIHEEEPERIIHSTVFILDNTLSQQARGQFAESQRELARQLRDLPEGDLAAVIELLASPHVLIPFGTDRDDASQRIRTLTPSHQRGSYRAAFLLAGELLRQSLGSQKRIVFLGDHQENQWEESGEGAPFLEDVELVLTPPRQRALPNLSLTQPRVRRYFVGDQAVAECLIDLTRSGPATSAHVEIESGGTMIGEETVQLSERDTTITLAFQWPVDSTRWLEGEVRVSGQPDELEADNRVVFSLPPIRVGTLDVLAESRFLLTALAPDVMQGRWSARFVVGENLEQSPADRDVLCIESGQLGEPQAWQRLQSYLRQEKGVFLVLNEVTPRIATQLRRLEIHVGDPVEPRDGSRLRYVFRDHPLFLPLASADVGDLFEMLVRTYHRTDIPGGQPLMFSREGDPLLWQGGRSGNLFVLGFGLDRTSTNWVIQSTFLPFLDQCLTQSRNLPPQHVEYAPGEICLWKVDEESPARQVVLRHGGAVIGRWPVESFSSRFAIPDQPGLYHLSYDDEPQPVAILPVNPSPDESELRFVDPDPFGERWVFRAVTDDGAGVEEMATPSATVLPSTVSPATMDRRAIVSQRIWWWFLLAAGSALLLETTWLTLRRESR